MRVKGAATSTQFNNERDIAERHYPQFFPSRQQDQVLAPYIYRHYPETGNYLGVAGTQIYVLGPIAGSDVTPAYVGEVSVFACQVFPSDCNSAPVARVNAQLNVFAGDSVTLDGSASSDPDGDLLTYIWTLDSRPADSNATLDSSTNVRATLYIDKPGSYNESLVVSDGRISSAPTSLTVTATKRDRAPIADAGTPQRVFRGTSVTLDGSGSIDPDGDPLIYEWTLVSRPAGSAAALDGRSTARPRFVADAVGSYRFSLVVSDGKSASSAATVEVVASAVPPNGLVVDVARDLSNRAAIERFLGGPLLAAWNPTTAGGPGMKIMMFGRVDSACPAGVPGPLGEFSDADLLEAGFPGSPAAVPTSMRFEAKPTPCLPSVASKRGPSRVFGDGSRIWLHTATLNRPNDLLRPFSSAGQEGSGANANILNTSVNQQLPYPWSPVRPWIGGKKAWLAGEVSVSRLQVTPGVALNQAKQQVGVTFDNMFCRSEFPGRLCSIQWLFAVAIAQSDVQDWRAVEWAQRPYVFGDPVQGDMPVVDVTLIPSAGTPASHATLLPFFTSRGDQTQHSSFGPRSFAVEIDFEQMKNALRIASAHMLGEQVSLDAPCQQCQRYFGSAWNDPTAWVVDGLLFMQEIYDASGRSAQITSNFTWLYVGPAP